MITDRRTMLKVLPAAAAALKGPAVTAQLSPSAPKANLSLEPPSGEPRRPLQQIELVLSGTGWESGTVVVCDGAGREYLREKAAARTTFTIGGALGRHTARLLDLQGAEAATIDFPVDCTTRIDDEGGLYRGLLEAVLWTMMSWNRDAPVSTVRYNGRVYQFFVNWIFDHTLTMKGLKYFWPNLKDAVDFFADTQREDGMIWENCYPETPDPNYFDWKFHYGGFVRRIDGGFSQLRRAPVESHVEQYFLEALYYTWKSTGDSAWMSGKLDAAIRAVRYVTSDPYRWSSKYQLVHRGFTIDTWDYVSDDQQEWGRSVFVVYLDKNQFGVFHGDNTNLIAGCRRLAEMLTAAGRSSEAPEFAKLADTLERRLNKLAWNGEFYTHWIAENPNYHPDVGVDMSTQVSLANAYALNRGIAHEKCVSILKTYQKIRREMPATSPGEFYGIYPPFQKDFTQNIPGLVWEYVNGGVLVVCGGELAHGAFEHGFEAYGADLLRRVKAISDRYRGYLPATLRGKAVEVPQPSFQKLSLANFANASHGMGKPGIPAWSSDPRLNLADLPHGPQEFQGIPFDVIDPEEAPHRSCVVLSRQAGDLDTFSLPVHAKAPAFYLLHAAAGREPAVGTLSIRYADGTSHTQYVDNGKTIGSWVFPTDSKYKMEGPRTEDILRVAWEKKTEDLQQVGVYAVGFDNPHPDREIASLDFHAGVSADRWLILAVTLSSAPVFFAPYDDLSSGMPDGWTASVVYALIEGLAGVKDEGVAFSHTALTPRWPAASVATAEVSVRYPASQGYCSYRYKLEEDRLQMDFTGSAEEFAVEVLLPGQKTARSVHLDGKPIKTSLRKVEESSYLVVPAAPAGSHRVEIHLA